MADDEGGEPDERSRGFDDGNGGNLLARRRLPQGRQRVAGALDQRSRPEAVRPLGWTRSFERPREANRGRILSAPFRSVNERRWSRVADAGGHLESPRGAIENARMPRPTASFRARPGLVRAGLALAAALAIGACSKSGGSPYSFPSVILVTVDTLRADRLSCYGYARETSPNVDRRIAARAVRFTNATAASNNTSCSFASIHTGTYVRTHGVISLAPLGYAVPERFETLAETLRGMGYATAAAVERRAPERGDLRARPGIRRLRGPRREGAEAPRRRHERSAPRPAPRPARDARGAGRRAAKKKPLFLWVHYFDPHWPYEPEAADVAALPLPAGASADEKLPDLKPVLAGDSDDGAFLRERADEISALYDGEIHEADRGVGELLDFLEAERVLENAIVLFTADHGENLGEHGLFFNHSRLYEPVIRVPLLVAAPGVEPRVASDLAHGIDIVPTVLDLLHASSRAPKELEGESLAPLLLRSRPPARDAVYSESGNWRDKAVKTAAGEKLILPPGLFGAELFDLASDPGETHDLANERPERRDAFARRRGVRGPRHVAVPDHRAARARPRARGSRRPRKRRAAERARPARARARGGGGRVRRGRGFGRLRRALRPRARRGDAPRRDARLPPVSRPPRLDRRRAGSDPWRRRARRPPARAVLLCPRRDARRRDRALGRARHDDPRRLVRPLRRSGPRRGAGLLRDDGRGRAPAPARRPIGRARRRSASRSRRAARSSSPTGSATGAASRRETSPPGLRARRPRSTSRRRCSPPRRRRTSRG